MECQSILFTDMQCQANRYHQPLPLPDCFLDLHLHQIEAALLEDEPGQGLESVFRQPLDTVAAIRYRQDVFRDIAKPGVRAGLELFAVSLCEMRRCLSQADLLPQAEQKAMWRLNAARHYCHAATRLDALLRAMPPQENAMPPLERIISSDALIGFSRWLHELVESHAFKSFTGSCDTLHERMHGIRYTLCCSDRMVHVRHDAGSVAAQSPAGQNLIESIRQTFAMVAPMPPTEPISFFTQLEMGALELQILANLRQLYPGEFSALATWDKSAPSFPDPGVAQFDRELRFYLAWFRLMDTLESLDCPCTLPEVTDDAPLHLQGLYDLALVMKQRHPAVANDCLLEGRERIMVLTGPNQGGKSTYARSLGQAAWLSVIGVPVPAREASMCRWDAILTHFATAENPDSASGRLQDELLRIRSLMHAASGRSLVLFNELFSTTATQDAIDLGRRVLDQIRSIGSSCLYVTHLAELAEPQADTVSLVAEVRADDTAIRTFRIQRRPADGLAHADSLASRYGLDAEGVRRRMSQNGRQGGVA